MAKMKFGLGQILACVASVLGLVALIMLFVPQLAGAPIVGGLKADPLSGLQITFGYSEDKVSVLNFSIGNFLTYVFVIVGLVFAVLALLGKLGKIAPIVSAAAFILAGIFFFCALAFTSVYVGELTGDAASKASETFKKMYQLGAGAIVGGIFSILAGGAMVAKLFIKK